MRRKGEEIKFKNLTGRIISALLINIILLSLFAPYSIVFASNDMSVRLNSDATQLKAGETVDVKIYIENESFAGMSGYLEYDTEIFEDVVKRNFSLSDNMDSGSYGNWTISYNTANNYFRVAEDEGNAYQIPDGHIATLTLTVIKDADTSDIKFTTVEIDGRTDIDGDNGYHNIQKIETTLPKPLPTHTVTYNHTENGGTTPNEIVNVAENAAIDLSKTADKSGYTFVGWNTNKDAKVGLTPTDTEATMGTQDVTLYAIFSKEVTAATCHYYDNTGVEQTIPVLGTIYNNDTNVEITLPTAPQDYTDTNGKTWTRKGWTTETSANTSNIILENTDVTTTNINTDYYMVYERNLNITYDSNGGSAIAQGSPVALIVTTNSSNINAIQGVEVTITNATPTKTGYEFQNAWTTNSDGTGASYTSGTTHTFTEDCILYANWDANTYTIKYDGNGNDSTNIPMPDTSYIYENNGDTGVALSTSTYTKAGYSFKGWSTTATNTTADYTDASIMPNADIIANSNTDKEVTLYAIWEVRTDTPYTVEHYKPQADGTYSTTPTDTENLKGTTDATATATPKPEYVGYVVDEAYSGTKKTGIITADGNLVLKLYYKIAEYTVTFDTNGGDALTNNTQTVTYGQTYGSLPTPTYSGQTFLGWFDDPVNGNQITSSSIVTQTKDHTLYAHWDIKTYTVEFIGKVNDGSPEGKDDVIKTVQVQHGSYINPTQLGIDLEALKQTVVTPKYTYTVNTANPFSGDLTSIVTSNRQIQINYNTPTINKYTVTFYDEGANPAVDAPLGTDTVDYAAVASDSRINPVKQEDNIYTYVFANWVDDTGNIDDLSNVIADRNVYATYTQIPKEYEVKFVDEDGITELSKKSDYHYDEMLNIPANPTKASTDEYTYVFEGWVDNTGNIVDLTNSKVTQNATYKAKYIKTKRQYTITFLDKDGVTPLGTSTVDYGTSAIAPNVTDFQDGLGYNYVFDKWVVDINQTPQIEDDLSNVIANRTVYATYTKNPISYKIKYEGTMDVANPNKVTYTVEDDDFTLLPLGQKVGMEFKGWYTDTTYTTQITSIEISKMDKTNLSDITIYAKWEIKGVMYFVKDSASTDNDTLASDKIYDNFDTAKAYVDTIFDEGRGTALGIYDLNNDLVYFPEVEPKLYYVKANETIDNSEAIEYDDFDAAKTYVDDQFKAGITIRIYDQNNKLIYEPKEENPKVQYFVKVNKDDPNTAQNTFDEFSDAKIFADQNVANQVKVYDINGEIVYEPQEKLYLRSEKYKIGENKLDEYEEDDLYLYRVAPNTTCADFKTSPNCITNGNITVYKQDGTVLGDNELVGTGMTLKDKLNGQVITLTIAVTGDLDGNGESDITDLVKIRRHIQNIDNITGIYTKAADIDEDANIDITDLVRVRRHIQGIEYIK